MSTGYAAEIDAADRRSYQKSIAETQFADVRADTV